MSKVAVTRIHLIRQVSRYIDNIEENLIAMDLEGVHEELESLKLYLESVEEKDG